MRQDIRIDVIDLVIAESATYTDQFMRPYRTELKGHMIDRIQERLDRTQRFTPSILASIANQFMVPDSRPRGIIEVPNGWHERRGRFILTIEITMGTGGRLRQVLMGYTNSVGFTDRKVDHDMEFYINNVFMLTERQFRTAGGAMRTEYYPTHANDVLSDRDNAGIRKRGDRRYTMRPEDIYSTIDAEQDHRLVDDLTDIRVTLNKGAIKSRTSNRIGSRYMAGILNSRQKAIKNEETGYGNSSMDLMATAQGYVQEAFVSDDVFMQTVANNRDLSRVGDTFTMGDLLDIDPTADDDRKLDLKLFDDNALGVTDFSRMDNINRLDGQEEEDRIAALIATAIPALMMELGIHSIGFDVHNQGVGHSFEFKPYKSSSLIQNLDLTPFIETFEDRLIDELLRPITADNRFDIGLKLQCRVFGEVDFTMFWDGKNRGRYVIPCFCNALSAPVVTDDLNDVKRAANDYNSLFKELLPDSLLGGSALDLGY